MHIGLLSLKCFALGWKESLRRWEKKLSKAVLMPAEKEPALKVFSPVNTNLPVLEEYEGTLSDEYWSSWTCNPCREEKGSSINNEEVRKVAEEMEFGEKRKVEEIAVMSEHGANI